MRSIPFHPPRQWDCSSPDAIAAPQRSFLWPRCPSRPPHMPRVVLLRCAQAQWWFGLGILYFHCVKLLLFCYYAWNCSFGKYELDVDPAVPGLGGLWVWSLLSARGFALESPQQGMRKHKRVALMGSLVKEVTLRSPNSEIKLLGPERRTWHSPLFSFTWAFNWSSCFSGPPGFWSPYPISCFCEMKHLVSVSLCLSGFVKHKWQWYQTAMCRVQETAFFLSRSVLSGFLTGPETTWNNRGLLTWGGIRHTWARDTAFLLAPPPASAPSGPVYPTPAPLSSFFPWKEKKKQNSWVLERLSASFLEFVNIFNFSRSLYLLYPWSWKMFPRNSLPCNFLQGKTTRCIKPVLFLANWRHFCKLFRATASGFGLSWTKLGGFRSEQVTDTFSGFPQTPFWSPGLGFPPSLLPILWPWFISIFWANQEV